MGLKKRDIDALQWDPEGPSRQIEWDGEIPGFGVRVLSSGTKSFVLRYKPKQKSTRRLMTLGRYGVLTLTKARKLARRELGKVAAGRDPLEERREAEEADRKAREAKAQELSVRDLVDRYVEEYAKPRKKTWKKDKRRLEREVVPRLGESTPATDVTQRDVEQLVTEIGEDAPTLANRVHEVVRKMFNWARGIYLPSDSSNPAVGVSRFKEKSRTRYLKPDECQRFLHAVRDLENTDARVALLLILYTGARKSEVLQIRWEDVDLERDVLEIIRSKSGKRQEIPLVPDAAKLLRSLPRENGAKYVFPGRFEGHRTTLQTPWNKVRKAAAIEDVTIHDLRRTAGSIMAQAGVPLQVIQDILGHQDEEVTKVYARVADENRREALAKVERVLAGAASGGSEASNELTMRELRRRLPDGEKVNSKDLRKLARDLET